MLSILSQLLHYKQRSHRGIQNILKDWYHFHTTHLHKNKLQEKKVTQYLQLHSFNNPNQYLHYKWYNHHRIQNILKDWFHQNITHLHKNKLQEKRLTQYQLQHSSNNLNQYLHYKQYNHHSIQNILKDWFHFHTTHLHKNKLQEKKVTQYLQLHSFNNPNQYLHYKQYNHRGIQNILKDWFHQNTTHLHKNKLQEKKVTQYQQLNKKCILNFQQLNTQCNRHGNSHIQILYLLPHLDTNSQYYQVHNRHCSHYGKFRSDIPRSHLYKQVNLLDHNHSKIHHNGSQQSIRNQNKQCNLRLSKDLDKQIYTYLHRDHHNNHNYNKWNLFQKSKYQDSSCQYSFIFWHNQHRNCHLPRQTNK